MSAVFELAHALIARRSVTPDDAGCQALIAQRLRACGFRIETLHRGDVCNLWATHGEEGPVLAFLGHTDVVPAGPVEAWCSDPFEPSAREGRLYGRGAADMKGSVAAFVVALEAFVAAHPRHPGTLALLLTSDEEGAAIDGVRHVARVFAGRGQRIDWCLVGEPSSREALGDVVRVGRRGSLTATMTVHGVQGHVAYPDLADNPIHRALPVLAELVGRDWDPDPFPDFPPTGFQIANVEAGTGASNVIPGTARIQFNLRYSPRWSADALVAEIEGIVARHGLRADIEWHRSGEPFHTAEGALRCAVREALAEEGVVPDENTGGGTSDGRFIAPLGADVVELGPVNASIHQVDEHIALADLTRLPAIYRRIAEALLLR
ncbi:succinyl-diaminopimelate desuccinylase [Coralloluteibacterium stylophorae]|uniref:Succinyl-diaminopimelate desuccinylase n=1 Tax=Coralloluteibacterium stylophorae TaxID=1776034 RepID=A0A8J8AXP5_9GAMM|nr:succinyl-diaminopimelate desuccinylase [Coralloluteibacterium stylophorae]MBS7456359.1 succinyl-diaminopimelate desuccinylase [Coralloluteibacterium stylophorae]